MNEKNILEDFKKNRKKVIENTNPSKTPGVYAFFLNKGIKLGEIDIGKNQIVYIGRTKNLRGRNHFFRSSSRRSSPRKTIGAILKKSLNLISVKERDSYKFSRESEEKLSNWMKNNMEYSYFILEEDQIKPVEDKLILLEEPILNIDRTWDNPNIESIDDLKESCKDEAIN